MANQQIDDPNSGAGRVDPTQPQYRTLLDKRFNKRFSGRPDYVRLVASTEQVADFDLACTTGWLEPAHESQNLAWVRAFYRDLFATTGGVPVPGDAYDGALINHPDIDLADPAWNHSRVPWHQLYYQANYSRLQRIKAKWDPQNVFRHALSIRIDPY